MPFLLSPLSTFAGKHGEIRSHLGQLAFELRPDNVLFAALVNQMQ